jgi:cell division transport system permease protein
VARVEAIRILHGLGATDGYIAACFAHRATVLVASGAALGAVAALPVLLGLASLASPFAQQPDAAGAAAPAGVLMLAAGLPGELWLALPALPAAAALIGFVTAQGTVRRWLRRLP